MIEHITNFFQTYGFMPHGVCLSWKPEVLWLMVASNFFIALSYFLIPFALIYVILRRDDFKFKAIFVLFGLFILLCGLTHVMSLVTFWQPVYGIQALVLLATAIVSVLTAIVIWQQIPVIINIPTSKQLEQKNAALKHANDMLIEEENKSSAILNAAPDAIIMVDKDGNIILANAQAFNLFGYSSSELVGNHLEILIPQRFREGHPKHRKSYFDNPRLRPMGANLELSAVHKDGKEFPVEISLSPMTTKQGVMGIAAIRDVSDKKRTEERLKHTKQLEEMTKTLEKQQKALLRSNEELDNFSYIASHDLREPLRGIHNYAEFLLEDYGDKFDEEARGMLQAIPRLSKKLDTLIDSLLQYSRIDRVELAYAQTDIKELVSEISESLEASMQLKNTKLIINDDLPNIYCDRIRLGEVFRNLISNAIKYNDKAEPIITVGFANDKNAFYVKDNGIGIDNDFHESIFRIFKRLHGQNKYGGGSGAGLTIVKKIIERHGGRIWVESKVGDGSCFYFSLAEGNFNA